ncbi:MAG TPA: LuxR C-terminal-related transcriptional regulator, partial [Dehalococcoidia bacterium]|nr:LuxR C-terminal-related transcriptional regulator [Dehalococcoidia bacterium]
GEAARASLAYEEAAWYFALALQALQWQPAPEDSQHGALLLALGEAQNWSGQAEAARDTFLAAAAIARRLGDAESLARAAIGYGAVAEAGTTDPVRIALLEEALAAAGGGARRTRVQTLNALAAALYWSEPERSIACSQQALDLATQLGDHLALAHALNARREALWRTEQLTERNAASTALQAAAEKAGDAELRLWAYRWRIVDLLELGDRAMMEREIAAHAGLTERLRPPLHVWYAARWRAMTALLAGRSAEAEDLVQRAHILGLRTRRRDATPLYIVQWGALRRQQGRADELVGRLRELVEQLPDAPVWRAGLAAVYAELGSFAEARRELERLAGAGFADLPRDTNWLVTLTSLAQVCAALPDPERAAQLYELLLPYSARFVVVGAAVVCHGAVAHYLALLATALGRWQAAQQHFVGAHALHQRLGARPWLAMTLAEHAALLASRGDADAQAEARALLAQANELARELGMAGVVRRAQLVRERLEAGRSRFPHASRGQDGALTAREREVARLLARGLTNRQIAQTLVISDRTADAHVANIFGKLGFNTRAQVAAWAVEAGLLSPGADG